jgi:hypothetical protein
MAYLWRLSATSGAMVRAPGKAAPLSRHGAAANPVAKATHQWASRHRSGQRDPLCGQRPFADVTGRAGHGLRLAVPQPSIQHPVALAARAPYI